MGFYLSDNVRQSLAFFIKMYRYRKEMVMSIDFYVEIADSKKGTAIIGSALLTLFN
ncbi:MAG: hypothetical protein ABIB41_01810 [Nitrospirota bacterium]